MKNFIIFLSILLALLVLSTQLACAQIGEQRNNLAIGFNGGVNMNNVTFQPGIKQKTAMGYYGGLTIRHMSEKYFKMLCGLQLEVNYVQRGWKEDYSESETPTNAYSRTMNYVEIPFMAHLAFGKEHRGMQYFLNLGPEIAFLLSETEHFSDSFVDTNPPATQHGKMADKKFDYGIVGGAGMELRTGIGNFVLEGRYYFGLSDFYDTSKTGLYGRAAHNIIQAKITYLFDVMK